LTSDSAGLLAVGRIVKAFGIKGELVVQPLTDKPARFRNLKRVFVGKDAGSVSDVRVGRVHVEPRGVRLCIEGVADRTAAERLVGSLLFVDERNRIKIPSGTYFVHDIVGLAVHDESGKRIGSVREVLRLPGHDVYVLDCEGREVMVPAVKEFVRAIDLESGTMTVRLIEGMLEGV